MNAKTLSGILQRFVATLAVAVLTASSTSAQVTSASVAGTVKDTQGGVIPGATVTLTSETQGTVFAPVVTNGTGDFVVVNIPADTYTVSVAMPSFKTLKKAGVKLSPGDRVNVGAMTLDLGGTAETVDVKGEAPLVQTATGERSLSIPTESVENLPITNRSFTAITAVVPGVSVGNNNAPTRIGGGGGNNIMIDGVSAVDTGSNAVLLQLNVESIAQVKVLTSTYQAEFGRSSGLQVIAVTKSGSNRFHGSLYDVERHDQWNANSMTNVLNGDPKQKQDERDLGFSIGGPIGRPGGNNKLFFFYAQEFAPRTQGGSPLLRYRVPTLLERQGNFSQTFDQNGNLFTLIKDPALAGACSTTNQSGCFANSTIPSNRIYGPGQQILNLYPLPNVDGKGLPYNYEIPTPTENVLGWQPALRVDYQPTNKIRITGKYSGFQQTNKEFVGTLPGLTASKQYKPLVYSDAFTLNYTLSNSTFLEATYGHSQNDLAGCGLAQGGSSPSFCTGGIPTSAMSNINAAGLTGLPTLFPNASALNPNYYAYEVLSALNPPMFQNGVLMKTPNFTLGGNGTRLANANAPPNVPFAGFLNSNKTDDVSISLTKVKGNHTIKGGFYNTHSFKAQNGGNNNTQFPTYNFTNNSNNPLDTGFVYSNVLLGVVNSLQQTSNYIEGDFIYNNTEFYLQDNWRVNNRLTLDYGMRFVHQQPQYDKLGQASNFLPDRWSLASAPVLFLAGCPGGAATCSGTTRQALNPITGQLLGPGSSVAIGTVVPGTGNSTNGLFLSGQGIANTTYTWPTMGFAPRVGGAYDLSGRQSLVVRGGFGIYYDRPSGNSIFSQVQNPPSQSNVTLNFAQLQNLGGSNLTTQAPPALNVFEYAGGLPTSAQWNVGAQMSLPWSSILDVAYVGQHSWNQYNNVNLNAIDFGTAFLAQNQDKTQAPTFLGSNTVSSDQMRAFLGYAGITQQNSYGYSTFHSLQFNYTRRFIRGLSFGASDTWALSTIQQQAARLQHNPDGSFSFRADQAASDKLLTPDAIAHTMVANAVWQIPSLRASNPTLKLLGYAANDWQITGVWKGTTGAPYTVGFSYNAGGTNANLTGSPDYAARVRVVGDPGSGCNADIYRQFNPAAFQGALPGSLGLESGANVVKGCFQQQLDLSLSRQVRFGGSRTIQFRLDAFNALNFSAVTNRNATETLANPSDPSTILNLPYDANGNLVPGRSQPKNAGFGMATTFQNPRTVQVQIRIGF